MTPDQRQSLLEQIADCVGPQAFNRLAQSVGDTRRKGRLRYWQEQLFKKLHGDANIEIASVDAFVSLFDGAERQPLPVPPPLTKEMFLQNPLGCLRSGRAVEVSADWFAE